MAVGVLEEPFPRRRPRLVFIQQRPNTGESIDNESEENDKAPRFVSWSFLLRQLMAAFGWKFYLMISAIILFRLLVSYTVQSFFDPDEYWQAMEVAHHIVFGYGHLTWEWGQQIRSYLHPLCFALLYKLLDILQIDTPWLVQWSPRFLQALMLVLQDISVFLLALRLFPANRTKIAVLSLAIELVLWFNSYCGVRTYSNCMETCCISLALLFWPFPDQISIVSYRPFQSVRTATAQCSTKHIVLALFFAGFSVAIRPTAGIFWFIMAIHFLVFPSSYSKVKFFGITSVFASFWITVLLVSDRIMYGEFVFVPWKFVQFNVLRGVGSFYGVHPFHWYFSNGLPVILFTILPLFMLGCFQIIKDQWTFHDKKKENQQCAQALLFAIVCYIFVFSCLGHKEFRFLYPIVPLMTIISGYGAFLFLHSPGFTFFSSSLITTTPSRFKLFLFVMILLANVPMFFYFAKMHQVGTISAVEFIQQDNSVDSVYFLLPCHQNPFYSFIHRNISLSFPDCSPPVGDDSSLIGYQTENSEFLSDPLHFVSVMFRLNSVVDSSSPSWTSKSLPLSLPSHFVTYEKIAASFLPSFFHAAGYQECQRFFHTATPLDDIQSDVLIYCRS